MTRVKVADLQGGYAGGLNTTSDPNFLRPDQARQMTNYRHNAYGAAARRLGTRKACSSALGTGSSGNPVLWWPSKASVLVQSGGTPHLYTAARPAAWTATNALSFTDQGAAATNFYTIFTDGTNEVVYLTAASGTFQKWDNAALSGAIAGATVCNGTVVYNQRLWGWASAAALNSIFYSAVQNGDTLGNTGSSGGQIIVRTFGASTIVRCVVVGSSLMIFHQQGISRLTGFGQSDITVSPQAVSPDVGALNTFAVAVYDNIAWVATRRGLYRVTEGSVTPVSTPDRPDPTIAAIAASTLSGSTVVFFNSVTNEVWVDIPNTGVYIYHTILGAWSGPFTASVGPYASGEVPQWAAVPDANFQFQVVTGGQTDGFPYVCDDPNYYKDAVAAAGTGGSAYTGTLQPHRVYGGSRSVAKSWRWANVVATLTTGGVAPVVTTSTELGSANAQTLSNLVSVTAPYYVQGAGAGPWLDTVITSAATTAELWETVDYEAYVLGQR